MATFRLLCRNSKFIKILRRVFREKLPDISIEITNKEINYSLNGDTANNKRVEALYWQTYDNYSKKYSKEASHRYSDCDCTLTTTATQRIAVVTMNATIASNDYNDYSEHHKKNKVLQGFVYSTSDNPTLKDTICIHPINDTDDTSMFSESIDLSFFNTLTVYIRAFVQYRYKDVVYGNTVQIIPLTVTIPQVTTEIVSPYGYSTDI